MSGLFQLLGLGARTLGAAQLAQATVGNNAANAATPGYSRRRVGLVEGPPVSTSAGLIGTGVLAATLTRLRSALIDTQRRLDSQEYNYSHAQAPIFESAAALLGPADEAGIATALNGLWAAFGDLSSRPEDAAVRQSLLAQGEDVVQSLSGARDQLLRLESDTFDTIRQRVTEVNEITTRLAALNASITERPNDPAIGDEKDRLVDRLAELIGVRPSIRADGNLQVVLDGTGIQLVDGSRAATITVSGTPTGGTVSLSVAGVTVSTTRGEIGGLMDVRNSSVDGLPFMVSKVDELAAGVIAAVNRVHASGSGLTLAQTTTGSVTVTNPAIPLTTAGLWLTPVSGTLNLGVFTGAGGFVSTSSVAINPAVMSLNDVATAIDALPDISASVSAGRLVINATNPANRIAFGSDTSDTLVALGVNGFFTGTDAGTIAVSSTLTATPTLIAAAQADLVAGVVSPGDNRNAQALAALATARSFASSTQTAAEFLGSFGATVGATGRAASTRADTREALLQAAEAQREAVSGVNVDEELADMVRFQHAYEAGARYLRTVDDMIKTLLELF